MFRRSHPPRFRTRSPRSEHRAPVSLSDRQLERVVAMTASLEPEKRSLLLERLGAALALRDSAVVSDDDVAVALVSAMVELSHHEPAAPAT